MPEQAATAPSAAGEMYLQVRAGLLPPGGGGAPPRARAPRAPSAPAAPGTNVIVNNPAADTPERTTQSETSLAVRGNTICAGFNDSNSAEGFSGFARSANLGGTWSDQGGLGAGASGDAALAVNRANGTFYYAEIATIGAQPAIGVARSTDGCTTFGAAVNAASVASGLAATTFNDKPSIAVDNTSGANTGNVYVCWTRFFSPNSSELRVSRSTNGGATYVNEQILQPNGTAPFGCHVDVGPTGQVYVVWADRIGTTAGDIRFASSANAGVTFGAAVSASTGNRLPGTDRVVNCPTANGPQQRTTLNGDIRQLHQAWMAVDTTGGPNNGNIYVVYVSDPAGATDNSDAFFTRSTNGGTTWAAPTQVGAGGGATDQFEPNVAVGGTGAVSVAWYDRRNDPTNNLNIDVFKTFSRDGGATLDPIVRVTPASFGVPPINPNFDPGVVNCYIGEYIAVVGDAQNFYYAWGDNRNTLVTTNFPNGRPDPDVFFEFEPAQAAPPQLSIGRAKVFEGDAAAGTRRANFTVTLSRPSTSTVTVHYATTDGTATSPDDFTAASGTVTFPPGSTSQTVVVFNGNEEDPSRAALDRPEPPGEAPELYTVTLSGAVGATIAHGTGQGKIIDDEPAPVDGPHIDIGNVGLYEGFAGSVARIRVSLSEAVASTVTVHFATADLTATVADHDYTPTSGTLTFPPGTTDQVVAVAVGGDNVVEPSELFTVNLSNAVGAPITTPTGRVRIFDGI